MERLVMAEGFKRAMEKKLFDPPGPIEEIKKKIMASVPPGGKVDKISIDGNTVNFDVMVPAAINHIDLSFEVKQKEDGKWEPKENKEFVEAMEELSKK